MLQKQAIPINFAKGIDTKTDPKQVQLGNFLALTNTVFNKGELLTKRNGFGQLPALPDTTSDFVTTFNGDLTAIGSDLKAYSSGYGKWVSRGDIQPVGLSVLPIIRNNTNQNQCDSAVAANGLVCTVYTDQNPTSLATPQYRYVVADSVTGQNIVSPTVISQADAALGTPRVFLLGSYFVVVFTNKVSSTYHLKYFAISTVTPTIVTVPSDISASYTPASTVAFDGAVLNGALFIAWNGASTSGIKTASLNANLVLSAVHNPDASHVSTIVSVTADITHEHVWVSYYNSGSSTGYSLAFDQQFASITAPTETIASGTILNLASSASNGLMTLFYEVSNNYGYDSGIPTHFISSVTINEAATVGTPAVVKRSVGLASKAFLYSGTIYFLAAFQSPYQPSYFLISSAGTIIAKLAYGNGGGYLLAGLPSITLTNNVVQIPYLFKDSVQAVSKATNPTAGTQTAGIYSQLGINLATFEIGGINTFTAEIGKNLSLTGGFLWGYDGYTPVENNFFLWPDSIEASWATTGGAIAAQPDGATNTDAYWYQVTYEWTDNQGNAYRSAPSVPVAVTTTGSGTTGSITIDVPTLRLTYKIANPVKIVIYRWSVAQQVYYQVTSISAPLLNNPTTDSVSFVDTLADTSILGNNIIYTTGGVVENVNGPAARSAFLFDDRLCLVPAEDPNNLWFSKQVIENTPVEMSDLLTEYVAPTLSAQGSSGDLICGAPMDDKAILFKKDAISYINGTGPDNTGANNQYSQPILITSTVGCANQRSIVFMPSGLMFQSDKGIWLLGRDLSTSYIGAPVEDFTQNATVLSAVSVPGTNQIRFTMSSGITLMYDYYFGQWGTFKNIPAISATLYRGLHTYINSRGQVFQESPGVYLDGSAPVLIGLTTSWINLAGLQGYQRAFFFYLLGTYLTPHKLNVSIAYDYNSAPTQTSLIGPTNFSPTYGGNAANGQQTVYGQDSPYGGQTNVEWWRVFLDQQRCSAFQITVQEIYDPSFGVPAGQGLTLSGINLVVALKKGFRPISAAHSVGGSGSNGGTGP